MVDDLKEEIEVPRIREDRRKTIDYPKNYETCMDMSRIVLKMISAYVNLIDIYHFIYTLVLVYLTQLSC